MLTTCENPARAAPVKNSGLGESASGRLRFCRIRFLFLTRGCAAIENCASASYNPAMGRDVDVMLARILAEAARGDEEAGRAKLKELTKAGRYQRDVY